MDSSKWKYPHPRQHPHHPCHDHVDHHHHPRHDQGDQPKRKRNPMLCTHPLSASSHSFFHWKWNYCTLLCILIIVLHFWLGIYGHYVLFVCLYLHVYLPVVYCMFVFLCTYILLNVHCAINLSERMKETSSGLFGISAPSLPVARHYLEPVRIAHLGFIQWSFQKTGPTSTTRLPSHRCCTYLPYPIDLHLKLGGGLENLWKFIHRQQ